MSFGLDYITGPPIADLKAAGVTFVCRYTGYFAGYNINELNTPQGKVLTPGEAKTLGAAGIALVSNYEWYENRATESADSGVWDAHTSEKIHLACGGPPDRPIYFSVDCDCAGSQTFDYFKGVASVIGLHRTGAYGSFRVLADLFNAGLIAWGWQTYAWSAGQWEPRAHIQQYQNDLWIAGLSVDYDHSIKSDFGQWTPGGTMVPTGWTDANNVLTAPNGVPVVKGFRDYVLSHNWDASNFPLAPEFGTAQLEASNTSLGSGTQQVFRESMLGWTQSKGVIFEWLGQELAYARAQIAKYGPAYQQLPIVQQQLQAAQDEIATLKQQLQTQGIPADKVANRLQAIKLLAKQIEQQATQPIS